MIDTQLRLTQDFKQKRKQQKEVWRTKVSELESQMKSERKTFGLAINTLTSISTNGQQYKELVQTKDEEIFRLKSLLQATQRRVRELEDEAKSQKISIREEESLDQLENEKKSLEFENKQTREVSSPESELEEEKDVVSELSRPKQLNFVSSENDEMDKLLIRILEDISPEFDQIRVERVGKNVQHNHIRSKEVQVRKQEGLGRSAQREVDSKSGGRLGARREVLTPLC